MLLDNKLREIAKDAMCDYIKLIVLQGGLNEKTTKNAVELLNLTKDEAYSDDRLKKFINTVIKSIIQLEKKINIGIYRFTTEDTIAIFLLGNICEHELINETTDIAKVIDGMNEAIKRSKEKNISNLITSVFLCIDECKKQQII